MSIVKPYCYTWNLDWTYGVIIVLLSTLDSIDIITPHGQIHIRYYGAAFFA